MSFKKNFLTTRKLKASEGFPNLQMVLFQWINEYFTYFLYLYIKLKDFEINAFMFYTLKMIKQIV
jgi:hypothetical protein